MSTYLRRGVSSVGTGYTLCVLDETRSRGEEKEIQHTREMPLQSQTRKHTVVHIAVASSAGFVAVMPASCDHTKRVNLWVIDVVLKKGTATCPANRSFY